MEADPKLMELRESDLRMGSVLHVVAGARTLSNKSFPPEMRPKKGQGRDHIATLEYLLEKGANVHMKDFAGYTAIHHATGLYSTDLTLKLAALLIEKGADINAKNRLGCTALFEAVMSAREEAVDFLLKRGAETDVTDTDGNNVSFLARKIPSICRKFIIQEKIKAKRMKATGKVEAGSPDIEPKACHVCQVAANTKFCSRCLSVRYCGSKCQTKDWEGHKAQCKEIVKGFIGFKIKNPPKKSIIFSNVVSTSSS